MSAEILKTFFSECQSQLDANEELADVVRAIAPRMKDLVDNADTFLTSDHYRSEPDHYARNLVFDDKETGLSLYTLVWEPGQWTPVHDHGTWGVVGVIDGQLEEQGYMRTDADQRPDRHEGIELHRGGLVLLTPGSVSTFVPNPDHIHKTGCADDRPRCVSLHLYGRSMNSFYSYDVEAGTRTLIEVAHTETQLGTVDA